jgi:hypothetical protein
MMNENTIMMNVVTGLASPPASWTGSVCAGNYTSWIGLSCSNGGNITQIALPSEIKGASINAFNDIYMLESLVYIDLSMNGLTGMFFYIYRIVPSQNRTETNLYNL